MRKILVSTFLLMALQSQAQTCDCTANFKWLKTTFEQNDAGFQHTLALKGSQAYQLHNEITQRDIAQINDFEACRELLDNWIKFFRKGHYSIQVNPKYLKSYTPIISSLHTDTPEGLEGNWTFNNAEIRLVKSENQYWAIMNQESSIWKKDQVIFTLNVDLKSGTYYNQQFKAIPTRDIEIIGYEYIKVGNKIITKNSLSIAAYVRVKRANETYAQQWNDSTVYVRIHSFFENKKSIDSVLNLWHPKIVTSKNLIIDLRDCTGGADNAFAQLKPYLYTQPTRTHMAEFYSTPLNNQIWKKVAEGADEEGKKTYEAIAQKMDANPNSFINIFGQYVVESQMKEVFPQPTNVGILINEMNFSATEEFLLWAKQSKKVKLFGRKTGGALDVSNLVEAVSPNEEFTLEYTISRSLRIPGMSVDDMGIHPDFYIEPAISGDKWVDFVINVFKYW